MLRLPDVPKPALTLALCLILPLAGCQRTLFEAPPAAALGCDPALAGQWLSKGDGKDVDGELRVLVDAQCSLHTVELRSDGERISGHTRVGTVDLGRQTIVVIDAAWANRSFDLQAGPLDRPGDVYLFAYRLRGTDTLQLLPVRHKAVAEWALADKLEADILLQDGSLTVRVRGDANAQRDQLRRLRLFDRAAPLTFLRAAAGTPP